MYTDFSLVHFDLDWVLQITARFFRVQIWDKLTKRTGVLWVEFLQSGRLLVGRWEDQRQTEVVRCQMKDVKDKMSLRGDISLPMRCRGQPEPRFIRSLDPGWWWWWLAWRWWWWWWWWWWWLAWRSGLPPVKYSFSGLSAWPMISSSRHNVFYKLPPPPLPHTSVTNDQEQDGARAPQANKPTVTLPPNQHFHLNSNISTQPTLPPNKHFHLNSNTSTQPTPPPEH